MIVFDNAFLIYQSVLLSYSPDLELHIIVYYIISPI